MKPKQKPVPIPKPHPDDGRIYVRHAEHRCICCGRETVSPSRKYVRVDRAYMHLAHEHEEHELAPVGPKCLTHNYQVLFPFLVRR